MRRLINITLTLLFIGALLFLGLKSSEPIHAFAANIMSRESFLAMTPYGVAEAHDTDTTLRKAPAIYWGYDTDGSVTISAGTYQNAFNSSCEFKVFITPFKDGSDTSTTGFTAHVKSPDYANSTFTYEVRQTVSGTVTDVTATCPVFWVAFGWR